MKVAVGAATDVGRVREGNEDSYLVEVPLVAVADGLGGHRAGEVASRLALETVEALFRSGEGSLADHFREANRTVFERSTRDQEFSGMGTTLTAAVVDGAKARLAHVGDSRAYLLRAGALRLLTEDHTLVNRMVQRGEITRAEAEVHPHRNVVLRALGTEPELDVDETSLALLDGDRLLLCTDGLTGMVTERQVQAILEAEPDAQKAAERLVRAANRAGGLDNITVVVLDVHEEEEGSGTSSPDSHANRHGAGGGSAGASRRWGLRAGAAVIAATVLLVGIRVYTDRQWYVGEADGHVAVYQGIPATIGGLRFSHVVEEEPDLPATTVERLPFYADLEKGITANGKDQAFAIVSRMRSDVAASRLGGTGQAQGTGS